jgi:hypothetical protein
MTTQAGLEKKERDFLALRRGDCPPAHAMTL